MGTLHRFVHPPITLGRRLGCAMITLMPIQALYFRGFKGHNLACPQCSGTMCLYKYIQYIDWHLGLAQQERADYM